MIKKKGGGGGGGGEEKGKNSVNGNSVAKCHRGTPRAKATHTERSQGYSSMVNWSSSSPATKGIKAVSIEPVYSQINRFACIGGGRIGHRALLGKESSAVALMGEAGK